MTRATVVGAGLAGAMLAAYLARAGHEVTAYESRPDLRVHELDSGRSINLALATRGIAALHELGLMPAVEPLLTPMAGRVIHDHDGRTSMQPYGTQPHEVIHSVSRNDLNAVLLDAAEEAGARLVFGARCLKGDLRRGQLVFGGIADDDVTIDAGVVFGADGINSPVRELLVEAGACTVEVQPLDHGYKELTLPAHRNGQPMLDPGGLHIWPRGEYMLIALPNLDRSFTCTLFVPTVGHPSLASLRTADNVETFFRNEFPDFAQLLPDLADEYLANPDGDLATVRVTGWSLEDRAVILGDAAHAIVPFHGQGMNAAFESCSILMQELAATSDRAAAFRSFERRRKPDTDAIADMALDNYVEMRAGVADPGYVLRRSVALELERRWPDRFRSRYAMVMFSTIPYSVAQERARRQSAMLHALTEGVASIDDIDFDRAEALIGALDHD